MRAMKRPRGSEIWVEDDAQVWALAEVVSQDNTLLTVRRTGSAEMESIDLVSLKKDRNLLYSAV